MAEGGASGPGRRVRNKPPDRRGGGRGSEGHTDGIIQFTGSVTQRRCPGDSCHHLPIYFLTPSLSKHFLASDGTANVPGEGDTGVMKSLPLPSRGSQSGTGDRGSASRSARRDTRSRRREHGTPSRAGGVGMGLRVGPPKRTLRQGLWCR